MPNKLEKHLFNIEKKLGSEPGADSSINNAPDRLEWHLTKIENLLGSSDLPSGGASATPDFAQNDSAASDYIKNRPFYEIPFETTVVVDYTFAPGELESEDYGDGSYVYTKSFNNASEIMSEALIIGETYNIIIDGTVYTLNAVDNYMYVNLEAKEQYNYAFSISTQNTNVFAVNFKGVTPPTTLKIEISNNKIISDVGFNATEYNGEDYRSKYGLRMWSPLVADGIYEVVYDGTTYKNVYVQEDSGYLVLGKDQNLGVLIMHQQDNFEYTAIFAAETQGQHTCKITRIFEIESEIKQIDEKFIPDTIARVSNLITEDRVNELIGNAIANLPNAEDWIL